MKACSATRNPFEVVLRDVVALRIFVALHPKLSVLLCPKADLVALLNRWNLILHKLNYYIYIYLFLEEYSDLDIWYRHVDQSNPSVISGISKAIDHLFTCHPNTATTFLSGIGLCQWEIQLWLFPISSTRQIGFIEDPIQCFTWVMAYWAFKQN